MDNNIFDNHAAFSRFMAYSGLRVNKTPVVSNFILAEKLKELVGKADKSLLEQVADKLYGNVGYNSAELVKQHLIICIESCGSEELKRALQIFQSKGVYDCFIYLVKL